MGCVAYSEIKVGQCGIKWELVHAVSKFRGATAINLDAKGRLSIPTKYRTVMQDAYHGQMVVTVDLHESCLLLYPAVIFEEIAEELDKLPSLNPKARQIQRLLIGYACDLEMDAQGRVLLPGILREHASIEKKLMLVGQGKKFEIWDALAWQKRRDVWLGQAQTWEDAGPDLDHLVF